MRTPRPFVLVSLLLVMPACTTSVELGQHDGGTPEPCGSVLCELGEVCCNAACGLCVAPGGTCIERSCGGPCDSFLAVGTGACRTTLGYAWNGASCAPVAGCDCVGIDCDRLYPDPDTCRASHVGCVVCLADLDCPAEEYCSYPMGGCGSPTTGVGTCAPRPIASACPTTFEPVCGCDGITYANACEANVAGTSILFPGECDACAPDDIEVLGDCAVAQGRYWNGMACVEAMGCECVGADCRTMIAPDAVSCERLHEGCLMPDLPCGTTACFGASEYCVIDGPTGDGRCMTSACLPPSCGCVSEAGMCSEDPMVGVTVFSY